MLPEPFCGNVAEKVVSAPHALAAQPAVENPGQEMIAVAFGHNAGLAYTARAFPRAFRGIAQHVQGRFRQRRVSLPPGTGQQRPLRFRHGEKAHGLAKGFQRGSLLPALFLKGGQAQPSPQPERFFFQGIAQGLFPVRRGGEFPEALVAWPQVGDELRVQAGGIAVHTGQPVDVRARGVAPSGGKEIGIGIVMRLASRRPPFVVNDNAFRNDAQPPVAAAQDKTQIHILIPVAVALMKAVACLKIRTAHRQAGSRNGLKRMRLAQSRMRSGKTGVQVPRIAEQGEKDAAMLVASIRVE